jgi:hypothetical protein
VKAVQAGIQFKKKNKSQTLNKILVADRGSTRQNFKPPSNDSNLQTSLRDTSYKHSTLRYEQWNSTTTTNNNNNNKEHDN